MSTDKGLKDEQSQNVPQHHRVATGAWLTGEKYAEELRETQGSNKDHGRVAVDKKNA